MDTTEDTDRPTSPSPRSQAQGLLVPQENDSIVVLRQKMTALADAVRCGRGTAAATNYAACPLQERDATKKAVAEMTPPERGAWDVYTQGRYPLPNIKWDTSREPTPTSTTPLRIARRRAEALNRLYKTDKAESGHSVWFTKNEPGHLPLVKAMARVIGAERNLLGGQCTLGAEEIADLQSINEILSVSGQILERSGRNAMAAAISSAQCTLGIQRNMLLEKAKGYGKKREQAFGDDTSDKRVLMRKK